MTDLLLLPPSEKKFYIGPSKIHGHGVLAATRLRKGESVGAGIVFSRVLGLVKVPHITDDLGVWINHAYEPTAELQKRDVGKPSEAWHIVAVRPLRRGEELTLNYNDCPWYIEEALPHYQ